MKLTYNQMCERQNIDKHGKVFTNSCSFQLLQHFVLTLSTKKCCEHNKID